jgi:hypothetical protein
MNQETQLNVMVAVKSIVQPDHGQSDLNFLAKIGDVQTASQLYATAEVNKQYYNQSDLIIKEEEVAQWDDGARNEVKDMKTSIINPEVHLTPTKEKKNVIETNQPEKE